MPAIDPERLTRQIEDLQTQSDDPGEIALEVRDLIEEYSDPTKTSGLAVPSPVIRSVRGALQQHEDPGAIAKQLWKTGLPDAKFLAAGMLEILESSQTAATADRWANQNVQIEIVQELGIRGLAGWRRADPNFLSQLATWLSDRKRRSRVLAVYALQGRVIDEDFEDLPSAFDLLKGRLDGARGEMQEALTTLMATLYRIAPEETAGFLDDEKPGPLVKALKARFNTERVGVV